MKSTEKNVEITFGDFMLKDSTITFPVNNITKRYRILRYSGTFKHPFEFRESVFESAKGLVGFTDQRQGHYIRL